MKIFCWNVRGVNKQIAREKIREFYNKLKFDILILVEPKIAPKNLTVMKLGLRDFANDIIHNGEGGAIANIWLISKRGLLVDRIAYSRQYISILVNICMITAVHGKGTCSLRRELWQHIQALPRDICGVVSLPGESRYVRRWYLVQKWCRGFYLGSCDGIGGGGNFLGGMCGDGGCCRNSCGEGMALAVD